MKFDLNNIKNKKSYLWWDIGWWWRWLPSFNLEELLRISQPVLSERNRINSKFISKLNYEIYKTEFFYQPSDYSLSIEEVTNNVFKWEYINRYQHTKFNPESKKITHFDGSINIYNEISKEQRKNTSLDKKSKISDKHIKLFRADWNILLEDRLDITLKRFSYNELVEERFDYFSYKQNYSEILEKDLDY